MVAARAIPSDEFQGYDTEEHNPGAKKSGVAQSNGYMDKRRLMLYAIMS